jgi:arabinofuranosyltransferase
VEQEQTEQHHASKELTQQSNSPRLVIDFALVFFFFVYFSSLLLSLGVSALAVTLFAFCLTRTPFVAAVGLILLAASKSVIDFSTSDLENPLTHLLIVWEDTTLDSAVGIERFAQQAHV